MNKKKRKITHIHVVFVSLNRSYLTRRFRMFSQQVLFSNLEEIRCVHRDFLTMVEELLQPDPHPHHEVGRCFLHFVSLRDQTHMLTYFLFYF